MGLGSGSDRDYSFIIIIGLLTLLCVIPTTQSWDPNNPNEDVKALCRTAHDWWWCISALNNGATQDADMHYLSIFARDLAEGNATWGIDYLNKSLLKFETDPYINQVMQVCLEAFVSVKSVLVNKLDLMIFESKYQEAKPWGLYSVHLIDSCQEVCSAKAGMKCPLFKDIYGTKDVLKLMNSAIDLILNGVI